jgi:hypothetical protein
VRYLLGLGAAGDRLNGARAPEVVADGALFARTELDRSHVAGRMSRFCGS